MLQLVEKIVHEATCPVIALIHAPDPDFVKEASKRGVFRLHHRRRRERLAELDRHRVTPLHRVPRSRRRLRPPRHHRAGAKGILMERHSIDEPEAFALLREHARSTNGKLVDVASAVVDGDRLLPKQPYSPASTAGPAG